MCSGSEAGVFKAHRLCVSLNSRLESNKEEEEKTRQSYHRVGIADRSFYFAVVLKHGEKQSYFVGG